MAMKFSQGHIMYAKLNELFDCMQRLGIHLSAQSDEIYVMDDAGKFPTTRLVDNETGEAISELPSACEYKLIYHPEE